MIRLPGILKVAVVLLVEFLAVLGLVNDPLIATIITGVIMLYVWLGGYPAHYRLFRPC